MTHRQVKCRSCGEYIVFLTTHTGKQMPVDANTVEETDEGFDNSRHVSHFATCDSPDGFRRKS